MQRKDGTQHTATLWAVCLGGIFTILAALIPLVLPRLSDSSLVREWNTKSDCQRAERIVREHFNLSEISVHECKWIDLIGDGLIKEFYLVFSAEGDPVGGRVILFTTRSEPPELLYHDQGVAEDVAAHYVNMAGERFFIFSRNGGSQNGLTVGIFKMNKMNGLDKVYEDLDDNGELFILDKGLFIVCAGIKYELVRTNDGFSKLPYLKRLTRPLSSTTGLLSLNWNTNGGLAFTFNGRPVRMHERTAVDPIQVSVLDTIIIDDNVGEGVDKIFCGGDAIRCERGFYFSVTALKPGEGHLGFQTGGINEITVKVIDRLRSD